MTHSFAGFGLRIRSELAIPGAQLSANVITEAECDLHIAWGAASETSETVQSGPYRLSPRWLVFESPGIARFYCGRDGRLLLIEPMTSVLTDIQAMLIATALPACLWLRGGFVLHAAVAALPGMDAAFAFTGPSGAGKSRLLKQVLARGGCVIAEDSVALHMQQGSVMGSVMGSGLPGAIFVRDAAAQTGTRTELAVPPAQQAGSARLLTLLMLVPRGGASGPGLMRLRGPDALSAMLNAVHRPRIPKLLGQSADMFRDAARLTNKLPLYLLNSAANQQVSLAQLAERMGAADRAGHVKLEG